MTPERWERVKEIYASAFHVRPSERPAFLDQACAQDAVLRQEVERLLRADQRRGRWAANPGSDGGVAPLNASFGQPYPSAAERALGNPTSLREAWRTIVGSLRNQSPLRIRFVR
jgi:hypothetical protein